MGPRATGPKAPVVVANIERHNQQQAEHAYGTGDHGRDGDGTERRGDWGGACWKHSWGGQL